VAAALVRGELVPGDVEVDAGRVVDVGRSPAGGGGVAVPGFVDLQVNGYGGVDFLSASTEDYVRAGEALLRAGVTAYQPTFITSPEAAIVEALRRMPSDGPGPQVLGAHLEGPFLSSECPGAHPLEHLRVPALDLLDRLLDGETLFGFAAAVKAAGADALIVHARKAWLQGLSPRENATAAEAQRAFDLGVMGLTHVFNAMRPFRPRDPGVAGVALTRPERRREDDPWTATTWPTRRCDSSGRARRGASPLITDAIAAAGVGRGTFRVGAVEVEVSDDATPRRKDGTLAGTTLTMIDAVRNLHALGVPFEDAVGAATAVPAAFLGRMDVGVLVPGGRADVVVLDDRLEIVSVLCDGEAIESHQKTPFGNDDPCCSGKANRQRGVAR